ncbi:MAG: M56 and MltD domain-containing protein [Bdellovibrionaceae bacterium]|nr:M56 and MltD domain-containing protein [Pseudobdellovibrionaceae bacterium]
MSEWFLGTAVYLIKVHLLLSFVALVAILTVRLSAFGTFAFFRRVFHFLLLGACLAPLLTTLAPRPDFFRAPVQVYGEFKSENQKAMQTPVPTVSFSWAPARPESQDGGLFLRFFLGSILAATAGSFLFRAWVWKRDARRLRKCLVGTTQFRSVGRVRLCVSPDAKIPFSAFSKGTAKVVLPFSLLEDWPSARMAIAHELQHHRQRDLAWLIVLEATQAVWGWNPLVRGFLKRIEEFHELACDEALLGRRGFDNNAYATCLVEVARTASGFHRSLVGTAGMSVAPAFLKRRVRMALCSRRCSRQQGRVWVTRIFAVMLAVMFTAAAWATEGVVSDRRLTWQQAQEFTRAMAPKTRVKVVITPEVLHFLNKATSTPQGRFYLRGVFKRMKGYEPMIRAKLTAANLPEELLAVPIWESGYQNIADRNSAGIWQFVPGTARKYGLRVDDEVDERFEEAKLTDAAIAYLAKLHREFGDWHAALLAYNIGERRLRELMSASGHKDVLRLIREGRLEGERAHYLPAVLAAMIIQHNPQLIQE